jgi:hypothetical protein
MEIIKTSGCCSPSAQIVDDKFQLDEVVAHISPIFTAMLASVLRG